MLGSSLIIHGVAGGAQTAQSPQGKKPSPAAANSPAAEPQSPPPAQIWLPPLQAPAHAPVISWDGTLLTIDAENSALSDILLGIRSRTGASIEMPTSTNRERIAAHLGPAPIREVLSSLLYGTNFNYVIQSADDDENALGKVILTARDADQSGDAAAADTVAGDGPTNPKVRLMPGYAAPGKRDFEVAHSSAADDNASTAAETPAAADSSSSPDQTATAVDSTGTQTDTQPATAKATDSTSPGDAPSLTAAGQPISGSAAGTVPGNSSGSASSGGGTALSQMEQNMQRLYQQRQQLQAQQGRPAQTPAP